MSAWSSNGVHVDPVSEEPRSGVRLAGMGTTVADLMSWPALVVSPETLAADAMVLAARRGVHHLPVVVRGDILGVLCVCDLWEVAPRTLVARCMSRPAETIAAGALAMEALAQMSARGVGCLPSRRDDVWGILTRGDLVREGLTQRRTCMACGAHHHVRAHRAGTFCLDCLETDVGEEAALYRDLGRGA